MNTERLGTGFLAIGTTCFLAGGLMVLLRVLGAEPMPQQQTVSLAVAGLMAVAVGAGLRRRA